MNAVQPMLPSLLGFFRPADIELMVPNNCGGDENNFDRKKMSRRGEKQAMEISWAESEDISLLP